MPQSRSVNRNFQRQIEEEYDKLRRYFISNNVSVSRLKWQPLVMNARTYKGRNVFNLINDCKRYPELDFNLAVEALTVEEYRKDFRYSIRLLPQISEDLKEDDVLLLYFKESYNANSLNLQLGRLEEQRQYKAAEIDDLMNLVYSNLKVPWQYTYMKLIPHGSYLTGLAFRKSPFNICIEMDEPDMDLFADKSIANITTRRYPANIDSVLRAHGGQHGMLDKSTNLIRFQINEFPVEIDFNKEITTESTYLILEYIKLDPRVKPLLNAIKNWGRDKSLFAPQYFRGIRFYSYTIMALAYLQQLDPPVIPNLQHINEYSNEDECIDNNCKSKFRYWDVVYDNGERVGIAARYHNCVQYGNNPGNATYGVKHDSATNKLYWMSSNVWGVGELFLDFLHYYGYRFDFQNDAVSLKFGGKTPKKSSWFNSPVAIEDPFMSRNLGEPATDFPKFIGDIRGSFTILQSGIPFSVMCKRIGDIMKYDSLRGRDNDRRAYLPLNSWVSFATSKTFLLIDLPKATEGMTYTDRIRKLFSTHGEIMLMLDLDSTTKQVFFNADTGNAKDIVLPTSFTLDGKTVYLVELYEYKDSERQHEPQNLLA